MGVIAAAVIAVAPGQVWGAGTAHADSARITLRFACSFPLIGSQAMTAVFDGNAPDSVPIGQPAPRLPIDVAAVVGSAVPAGLGILGATTVDGTAAPAVAAVAAALVGGCPAETPSYPPPVGVIRNHRAKGSFPVPRISSRRDQAAI
jgi:hypothetical protein